MQANILSLSNTTQTQMQTHLFQSFEQDNTKYQTILKLFCI